MARALSGFKYLLQTPLDQVKAHGSDVPDEADFTDIGGFRSNDLENSANPIEITNKSSGENREILNKRGLVSLNFSGAGILYNSQIHHDLEANVYSQDLRWFRIIREDGRKFIAKCKISNWNTSSAHDNAVNFSGTFMSAGTIYIKGPGNFAFDTASNRITAFNNQAAQVQFRKTKSADYAFANIPSVNARKAAIEATLDAANLAGLAAALTGPNDDVSLDGAAAANMFAFPVLFIRKSDLEPAGQPVRTIQILDSLDETIEPQTLKDYDIGGTVYRAFYFVPPLGMGESLSVKIQAG